MGDLFALAIVLLALGCFLVYFIADSSIDDDNAERSLDSKKAIEWAKSIGYPIPTKPDGCSTGCLVVLGLTAAIIPGILVLFWLMNKERDYKLDIKALVFKWIDAGRPEPGQQSVPVQELERIEPENTYLNSKSIEQRIEELNQLREKGLISEDEYQTMRKDSLGI